MNINNARQYIYRAVDQFGQVTKGSAFASSPTNLYFHLQEQKLSLLNCRSTAGLSLSSLFKRSKVQTQDLLDFCLHMQYMDQAGVSILDALQDAKSSLSNLTAVLEDLILRIKNGAHLSGAMIYHETVFPPLFRHIIELSERSGCLSDGFKKLHNHLSWSDQNRKQLGKSLRYPALVFSLICFVIWLMMSLVVPQMKDLILLSGTELPSSSRYLINISTGIATWTPVALGLIIFIAIILICARLIASSQRLQQDRWLLKIPYIGPLWQKRDLALYLHFFSVCLSAGIDLLDCLDHSVHAVSNMWLRHKLKLLQIKIREGAALSEAFRCAAVFDSSTIRFIQIGERTGQLSPLLATLESYHMNDLKRQLDKFLAYLQPTLLAVIGLMLIWIVLGIFYPMYDHLLIMEGVY